MPVSQEEFDAMQKRLDAAEAKAKKAEDDKAAFERKEQERVQEERDIKVKHNRKEATLMLNKAVEGREMLPAQRDVFTKMLNLDDDDACYALDLDDVKSLVASVSKPPKSAQGQGQFNDDGTSDDDVGDAGDFINQKALELQVEKDISYTKALELAMRLHPKEAKAHVFATGTTADVA